MTDKITGVLEVGSIGGEVVVNHPDLKPDENGVGHIVFSPNQARNLAALLLKQAAIAEDQSKPPPPPVDRTKRVLTDGSPVPEDYSHTQDRGDGQQKGYIVLSASERAKGFVRPVRQKYVHKPCGVVTHMGLALAETYARDPGFYSGTFCVGCRAHFPLDQFVWDGTDEMLGS